MTGSGKKGFVVLLDAEQLSELFADWPTRMNLAVCLRQEGECRMQVYRQEEGLRILPRVLHAMRLTKSEVSIFPEVEGYPARSMYFSEEKRLFEIVQNAPEIVEEASDYSVNYTYAMDEGLDPVLFLHASKTRGGPKQSVSVQERRSTQNEHVFKSKRETPVGEKKRRDKNPTPSVNPNLPKFLQEPKIAKEKLPITPVEKKRKASPTPRFCVVQDSRNGWISIELPGGIGEEVLVTKPEQVFLRVDRCALTFDRNVIGDVSRAFPKRIHVNLGKEETLLTDVLRKNIGVVRADLRDGLLLLELRYETEDEAASLPSAEVASEAKNWKSWASAGVIATFSLVLLLSFFPSHRSQIESNIDWSQLRGDNTEDSVSSFRSQLRLLDLTLKADG